MSMVTSNVSVRMVCVLDGWPGQHSQQCCFNLCRVNTATASHAVHIISISIAIAIAIRFTLNAWCNRLSCPLKLSERKCSAWHLNRRIPRVGHVDSGQNSAVHVRLHARCIRSVAESIWLVWKLFYSTDRSIRICLNARHVRVPTGHVRMAPNAICHISTTSCISSNQVRARILSMAYNIHFSSVGHV
ncbi:hypothetical protein SCLCIDRAFT_30611 [Scleroderma citrinum Foug A]|uniref:Uncharacterized protein n=1 Tax=Scleroderma citrinum Foug A TaxID=1036808 RepID=A0A0C3DFF5_9AGAM|nr:hypothetical protein SCLCIDRAFT_30611 [Scleroderma citrinum Foug A]